MSLTKFLLVISLITFFSLLYVHQQAEIFRFAYSNQKQQAIFEDLLDKNTHLRYNTQQSISLVRIGNKISYGKEFEIPDNFRFVKLEYPKKITAKHYASKKENVFSRIFAIKRQAEAKTILSSTQFREKDKY